MDQIRIAADSSCDLLTMDGVDFVSVPLTVRTAVEEFRDDAALDVDAMVTTLRGTKGRTFSACPNIADWESAFGESGDVLAFTITSSLSGSCSAALAAKKRCEEQNPSRRIFVVDTLSAGPEIALLIEKSAAELRSGKSFEEVCTAVQQYQRRTHLLFALESMHNLAQNGRYDKKRMQLPCQQKRRSCCTAGVSACAKAKARVEQQQRRDGNDIREKQDMDEPRAWRQH